MTTLETLKTEGHRARASAVAVDDFVGGGWGAHLVHTHTLCRRAVRFFYCYIMHAAPAPARRTRLVPASSVKSEKMRRPRFVFVGFFLQILLSRTSVRPSVAAPAPTARRRMRRAYTIAGQEVLGAPATGGSIILSYYITVHILLYLCATVRCRSCTSVSLTTVGQREELAFVVVNSRQLRLRITFLITNETSFQYDFKLVSSLLSMRVARLAPPTLRTKSIIPIIGE